MYDERVHVAGLVAEAGQAVAALLRGAELVLEERVVFCADYAEVVGHVLSVGRGAELRGRNDFVEKGRGIYMTWDEVRRCSLVEQVMSGIVIPPFTRVQEL